MFIIGKATFYEICLFLEIMHGLSNREVMPIYVSYEGMLKSVCVPVVFDDIMFHVNG